MLQRPRPPLVDRAGRQYQASCESPSACSAGGALPRAASARSLIRLGFSHSRPMSVPCPCVWQRAISSWRSAGRRHPALTRLAHCRTARALARRQSRASRLPHRTYSNRGRGVGSSRGAIPRTAARSVGLVVPRSRRRARACLEARLVLKELDTGRTLDFETWIKRDAFVNSHATGICDRHRRRRRTRFPAEVPSSSRISMLGCSRPSRRIRSATCRSWCAPPRASRSASDRPDARAQSATCAMVESL